MTLSRNPISLLTQITPAVLGKIAKTVKPNAALANTPTLPHSFNLNTRFITHQKLATLSSNKPRAKGKIL